MNAPHSAAERVCARAGCGQRFTPKRSDARYCGDECRWAANRANRAMRTDMPRSDTGSRSAITAASVPVGLTWEPAIDPRSAYQTAEPCADCGTPLLAHARGTWRFCSQCQCPVVPAAVAAPYEHGSQRQVVSQRDRDLDALGLARRKGSILGKLRRMIDSGLDDEACAAVKWFADEVESAASGRRLDELAVLFGEAGIRARPAPAAVAYDETDIDDDADGEIADDGYRPPPPRLMLAPPPAEPDWQWALGQLGWAVHFQLKAGRCHIARGGASCDGPQLHNLGDHHGLQVWVCGPCYTVVAKTISTEQRRRA
jgi:hypothetical protein